MDSKKINFGDDGEYDFDLTFKSYDEMKELLKHQGVLNDEIIENSLLSTVEIADSIDNYELDTSIKYPKN